MLICSHLCSMSLKRRKKSKSFLFRCTGIQQLNPHISNYTFVIKICLLRILLLWLKLSGYSKRVFSLNSHQQEKKSLQRQIWALKVVRKSSIPFLKCLLINKASAVNSAILSLNCLEWSFVKVIYKENSCVGCSWWFIFHCQPLLTQHLMSLFQSWQVTNNKWVT